MNNELSELDLKEREETARPRRESEKTRRTPPSGSLLGVLALALSIAALIVAGTALALVLRGYKETSSRRSRLPSGLGTWS